MGGPGQGDPDTHCELLTLCQSLSITPKEGGHSAGEGAWRGGWSSGEEAIATYFVHRQESDTQLLL